MDIFKKYAKAKQKEKDIKQEIKDMQAPIIALIEKLNTNNKHEIKEGKFTIKQGAKVYKYSEKAMSAVEEIENMREERLAKFKEAMKKLQDKIIEESEDFDKKIEEIKSRDIEKENATEIKDGKILQFTASKK